MNSCGIWNEREIPSRAMLLGERFSIATPSSAIEPPSGFRYPVTMLTKVVLPAPLAPIRLTFWPEGISIDKPSAAITAPKRLFTPLTESSGFTTVPLLRQSSVSRSPDQFLSVGGQPTATRYRAG